MVLIETDRIHLSGWVSTVTVKLKMVNFGLCIGLILLLILDIIQMTAVK